MKKIIPSKNETIQEVAEYSLENKFLKKMKEIDKTWQSEYMASSLTIGT